jgi:hypothetical protein
MDLQGKTVASTFQFLLNQSGANPITLGDGGAVDWTSAGVVTTSNISSSATTAVTAGSGLAGGGTVGSLTLNVGSGDGITVNADNISVNSTVVRTTGAQTIGGTKTFDSAIQGITTGANALTTSRTLWGQSFNGNADVTGSLTGVGDITFGTSTNKITATASTPSANRTYTIPDVGGNASFVMTTGTQEIGGTKNFTTRPTVSGTGVLLQGEAGGGGGGISTITAGSGLAGGGSSSTVTLDVGQGDGIIVSENDIAVDSSVVRTNGNQTIAGIKTFDNQIVNAANANSHLAANSYIACGTSNNINIISDSSFIGGGGNNNINDSYSFVGGGSSNTIYSQYSSAVGGLNNIIESYSNYSVICGGTGNIIYDENEEDNIPFSFIGGGQNNIIRGGESVIVGGKNNETFGTDFEASCFIGGGTNNKVFGYNAAIVAGLNNLCSGDRSFIGGGQSNQINGVEYASIVGGRRAIIASDHTGAGLWADGQDRDHNSKGAHTLSLDFANGVHIPTGGLYVTGDTSFNTRPTVNNSEVALLGDYVTGSLDTNVSLADPNAWYAGPSMSLTSGVWMVNGFVTLSNSTSTTVGLLQARITGGATAYASTQVYSASTASNTSVVSLHLSSVVSLTSTTQVGISAARTNGANRIILAALTSNGQGNNASQISAYRIG